MKWLSQRLLAAIPTILGASFVAFVIIRLVPGDPVLLLLGERGGEPEVVQEMQRQLGLDLPWWHQYGKFLAHAVTLDFGVSIVSQRSVTSEFFDRFPATLELSFFALLFAVILGVPLGVIAALQRGKFWDYTLMGSALIGYSMPIFWWGLMMIFFFSVHLGWTPVSGRMPAHLDIEPYTGFMLIDVWMRGYGWREGLELLRYLALPTIVLGTVPLAAIARMTRSCLLEVLREDFVRTAKAKGLSFYAVTIRHALRNALIPIITTLGLMVGALLTGAVLTETVFSWPGLGRWLVASVQARDYPVIQGGVLLVSTLIVSVNILVDALYIWANPQMRNS